VRPAIKVVFGSGGCVPDDAEGAVDLVGGAGVHWLLAEHPAGKQNGAFTAAETPSQLVRAPHMLMLGS
jgi:hypothetical protein